MNDEEPVFDLMEETDSESDLIDTPFNPSSVDIVDQSRSVATLLERLKHNELLLTPDYQRQANLWDDKKKSRLIESILLKIPLPSFYFSENENGDYEVVDGLQRLCSIFHFKDVDALNSITGSKLNLLKLTEMQYLKELNGLGYGDLGRQFQRRIDELEIKINLIRVSTPREVMFNVFARLNQGGLPLTAQEIRNAIFPKGQWRQRIRALAEGSAFLDATKRKIPTGRQQDMEMVLRVIALLALEQPYLRHPDQTLDEFLNNAVSDALLNWKDADWINATERFELGMKRAVEVFGQHAFRKSSGSAKLAPIHKGLFESQVVTLSDLGPLEYEKVKACRDEIGTRFGKELEGVSSLATALRSGTGKGASSNTRLAFFRGLFRSVTANA